MGDEFLPTDYNVPKESRYMKLQEGENRLRILSSPILGWQDWEDKKPIRFTMDKKPESPIDADKPVRHFWAMVVYNYKDEKIQILELVQSTIQNSIKSLATDPDWGDPKKYDIKITKKKEGGKTSYTVAPVPHKELAKEIQEEYDGMTITLNALYDGGDPFKQLF